MISCRFALKLMFDCCVVHNERGEDEHSLNIPTKRDEPAIRDISIDAEEVKFNRNRRAGVSAEAVTRERIENWEPKIFPKSPQDRIDIKRVIQSKLQVLFGHLTSEALENVIDSLESGIIESGTNVIKQGDVGDYFYIVKAGSFDIYVKRGNEPPSKVAVKGPGDSFGELALLYNAPRAATVRATSRSTVWRLDRDAFQMMLVTELNTKARQYEAMLNKIELFNALNKFEKGQVSDMLVHETYSNNEIIIRQGEVGDKFYLLESGECVAKLKGPKHTDPEVPVKYYRTGDYFGEIALLSNISDSRPLRKASVYACNGPVSVLSLDRSAFDRVLGPIKDLMKERAELYPSYAQVSPQRK